MSKFIKFFEPKFDNTEKKYLLSVLKSGWLTNGPLTIKFEDKIKTYLNCKNAIAVNSCTNGIIAVIKSLNLRENDEILTTPQTFVSVIHALELFKLKIKLIDVNYDNFSLNLESLKKNLTSKTKCVLFTHYGGVPSDLRPIINFCKKKNIFLIEDAATAFGSSVNKKKIGSYNNIITVFSFYANKIITSGEGGAITLNNNNLAKKIRTIISCGISKSPWQRDLKKKNNWHYDVKNFGFKFNFSDIQAAIGISQLKKINQIINYRKFLRSIYDKKFDDLIEQGLIKVYKKKSGIIYSEYIYTILLNGEKLKGKRDDLIKYLKKNNVASTVHYIPANKHQFYKKKFKKFNLKNSDNIFKNIVSLPFHNKLKKRDISKVSKLVIGFIKKNKYSK